MWLPFICLAIGAMISKWVRKWADLAMHYSLMVLLLGLGVRIGADQKILASIAALGLKALAICLLSSAVSLLLTIIWEKACIKNGLHNGAEDKAAYNQAFAHEYRFIISVVLFLVLGTVLGNFFPELGKWAGQGINVALVIIYVSVGVGLKDGITGLGPIPNKMAYLIMPVLILLGSVGGGLLASLFFDMKPLMLGSIGAGVGYYSLTAAMITQKAGVELGFIAFMTNFLREVSTFFLTPILVRLSYLAPIAWGGATTMDTTLAVMKRFLGEEYAILAFISGTLLTLLVPVSLLFLLSI